MVLVSSQAPTPVEVELGCDNLVHAEIWWWFRANLVIDFGYTLALAKSNNIENEEISYEKIFEDNVKHQKKDYERF